MIDKKIGALDRVKDGVEDATDQIHEKVSGFHDNYASKVIPDCGKYGDEAAFAAERISGTSENEAIKEGDWQEFANAAGIDATLLALGAVTGGAEYEAIKSAMADVKAAVKEVAEAGSEKIGKETVETGVEKEMKEPVGDMVEQGAIRRIKCKNEHLEDQTNKLGVKYVRRIVNDGMGRKIEGVFPEFSSKFDTTISKELYHSSNEKQFKVATENLKKQIEMSPELRKQFTPEQLEQIKAGQTPDGYVWHHNEEAGVLQLVDAAVHAKTSHTGGRSIWGGGY